jgi:hypothetical protein
MLFGGFDWPLCMAKSKSASAAACFVTEQRKFFSPQPCWC